MFGIEGKTFEEYQNLWEKVGSMGITGLDDIELSEKDGCLSVLSDIEIQAIVSLKNVNKKVYIDFAPYYQEYEDFWRNSLCAYNGEELVKTTYADFKQHGIECFLYPTNEENTEIWQFIDIEMGFVDYFLRDILNKERAKIAHQFGKIIAEKYSAILNSLEIKNIYFKSKLTVENIFDENFPSFLFAKVAVQRNVPENFASISKENFLKLVAREYTKQYQLYIDGLSLDFSTPNIKVLNPYTEANIL